MGALGGFHVCRERDLLAYLNELWRRILWRGDIDRIGK